MKDFVDWLVIVSSSELVRTGSGQPGADIIYGYRRLEAGDKSNLYAVTQAHILYCERLMYDDK